MFNIRQIIESDQVHIYFLFIFDIKACKQCTYNICVWILLKLSLFSQNTLEAAENLIKKHEAFVTTMDANDEKVNAVLLFANRLIDDNHFSADKVHKKAENISER